MKKSKKYLASIILILLSSLFVLQAPVFAGPETSDRYGVSYVGASGLSDQNLSVMIARIINTLLGVLGILLVILIIYGGFIWMTAGGNEENVKKAKKIIFSAVVGLLIILSAYAVSRFVFWSLARAVQTPGVR